MKTDKTLNHNVFSENFRKGCPIKAAEAKYLHDLDQEKKNWATMKTKLKFNMVLWYANPVQHSNLLVGFLWERGILLFFKTKILSVILGS